MSDSLLQTFLHEGTQAERLAFTPDPPDVSGSPAPVIYQWAETDNPGDVYVYTGGSWEGPYQPGSGNTTATGTEAAIPTASTAGDLYLPNDGVWLQRDTGAAWVPWGPIWPLADPSLQTWSWVNQGSATITTSSGAHVLYQPTASASVAIRAMTAPATPYTVTAMCLHASQSLTGQVMIGFRESGSGKLATVALLGSGTTEIQKWTNPTTFSANYTTVSGLYPTVYYKSPIWLRISDTGTDRVISVSGDGLTFRQLHTVGRTDFLTADQVFFAANQDTSGTPAILTLLSWSIT